MKLIQIVKDYEIIADVPHRDRFFGGSAAIKEIIYHAFDDSSRPIKVLDIGFGMGLLGKFIKDSDSIRHWEIDGIDGFYDTCCNRGLFEQKLYRNIWHGMAQDLGAELLKSYDLICLLDVIEHLTEVEARTLLKNLLTSLGNNSRLYISTPLFFYPQNQLQPGDLEEHKIGVPASSMVMLKPHAFVINQDGLCGNFILSRNSIPFVDGFTAYSDASFNAEKGYANCVAMNMRIDDGSRTVFGLNWEN